MSMEFGRWLRERRRQRGLTMREVADLAECSLAYVSRLENDVPSSRTGAPPRPSVEMVDALAKAVGAPVIEARMMAGYAPLQTESDAETQRVIALFQSLSKDKRELALTLLESLARHSRRIVLRDSDRPTSSQEVGVEMRPPKKKVNAR